MHVASRRLPMWVVLAALMLPAPASHAQSSPTQRDEERPRRVEPGLADRKARYAPSTVKKVALAPVRLIELPFVILNYPFEKWLIRKEPIKPIQAGIAGWRRLTRTGVLVRWGGFGQNSGLGGGLGYRVPPAALGGSQLRVFGGLTNNGYEQYYAQFATPRDANLQIGARVEYFDRPRENLFGVGLDSSVDDRSSYRLATTSFLSAAQWRVGTHWKFWGEVGFSRNDTGEGEDEGYPTSQELFPGLEGLEGRFDFVDYGAAVTWEGRDNNHYASRGSYVSLAARFADGVYGTENAYAKYSAELQQYVPLPGVRRVVALRLFGIVTDNRSSAHEDIPVFRLESIGGSTTMRGYRDFRYTDKDVLFGNVEYRFPFWWIEHESGIAIDALAFFDYGTALPNLEKMQQRHFRSAAGLGFRVATYLSFLGRVDFGWSPEGFRAHAGLRWNFKGVDYSE